MPCGDADGDETEAFCEAVRFTLTFWPETPEGFAVLVAGFCVVATGGALAGAETVAGRCAEATETDGVVRGGAMGVLRIAGAVRTWEVCLVSGTSSAVRATSSGARGGASRSSSRAAAGGAVAGWRPVGLAFRDRRLIRGTSDAGLSKLNSVGSALESDWAEGGGVSAMTHPQITPLFGNSKT